MTEIEVKLRLPDVVEARTRLERAGGTPLGPRQFEDNWLYDDAAGNLKRSQTVLRLRSIGERRLVTFKAPPDPATANERYKIRAEYETSIGELEPLDELFRALGYSPRWRYQKWRQSFSLLGLKAELDETPLGCFIELEGDRAAIDRAAQALGFTPADFITDTYRDLQLAATGNESPGDLVFSSAP